MVVFLQRPVLEGLCSQIYSYLPWAPRLMVDERHADWLHGASPPHGCSPRSAFVGQAAVSARAARANRPDDVLSHWASLCWIRWYFSLRNWSTVERETPSAVEIDDRPFWARLALRSGTIRARVHS